MTVVAREGAALPRSAPRVPWTFSAFSRFVLMQVLMLVAILACFIGARHTRIWDHQLYWLVGAITALLVAAGGWTVWLANGARGLRVRQLATDAAIVPLAERFTSAPASGIARSALVSGPDMRRFHRADCPLAETKAVVEVAADEVVAEGKLPCGVCLP